MGIFDKVTDTLKGVIGVRARGSGGSRDAYNLFVKFRDELNPYMESAIANANQQVGQNPYLSQIGQPFERAYGFQQEATDAIKPLLGRGQAIAERVASSQRGAIARNVAVAARTAAGGRGGLAFGGGAGAIASRAATQGSVAQGQVLAEALSRGLQQDTQSADIFQRNAFLGTQIAGAESNARAQQAALYNQGLGRVDQFRLAQIQAFNNLALGALGGGLTGDRARSDRKLGYYTAAAQAAGNAAGKVGGG